MALIGKPSYRPVGASWAQAYGMSLLCEVGLTMSLFAGLLAFSGATDPETATKIGVLAGFLLSMAFGVITLLPSNLTARVPALG